MATDVQVSESVPPPDWDSDALKFYEVVDGRIVENLPMGALESLLASSLQSLMGSFADANGLGRVATETLCLIDQARNLRRRPDLAFISAQRWPLERPVPRTEAWDVVPDLAAEFISQTNNADQVAIKIEEYFQASVRIVWVIYPVTCKVYIYNSPTSVRILQLGDELDGEEVIPGFRVALSTLFKKGREEPPNDELTGWMEIALRMSSIDIGPSKAELRSPPDLIALWAAFTIWVAIHAILLSFCVAIPVLWATMWILGRHWSIASRLSTGTTADRLAWVTFSFGIYAMLGVVWIALGSEGDGDFRSWPEIRRHVRFFLGAGIVAAGVPAIVTIAPYLVRVFRSARSMSKNPSRPSD